MNVETTTNYKQDGARVGEALAQEGYIRLLPSIICLSVPRAEVSFDDPARERLLLKDYLQQLGELALIDVKEYFGDYDDKDQFVYGLLGRVAEVGIVENKDQFPWPPDGVL